MSALPLRLVEPYDAQNDLDAVFDLHRGGKLEVVQIGRAHV